MNNIDDINIVNVHEHDFEKKGDKVYTTVKEYIVDKAKMIRKGYIEIGTDIAIVEGNSILIAFYGNSENNLFTYLKSLGASITMEKNKEIRFLAPLTGIYKGYYICEMYGHKFIARSFNDVLFQFHYSIEEFGLKEDITYLDIINKYVEYREDFDEIDL